MAVAGDRRRARRAPRPPGSGSSRPARERRRGRRHGVLVLLLARTLWPARPVIWLAAVGFFAFLPTVVKTGAMFHPEPLGMLDHGRRAPRPRAHGSRAPYAWWLAVSLGLLLGLGPARSRMVALDGRVVAVVVLVVVAVTDRSAAQAGADGARGRGACSRRSFPPRGTCTRRRGTRTRSSTARRRTRSSSRGGRSSFYVDARLPEVVRSPWRDGFNDRFWPVLYAETWGDYFGIWSWGPGRAERTDAIDATLVASERARAAADGSRAGRSRGASRPRGRRVRARTWARLVAALPPVAAVASILYLLVAYPTSDGDTIKGTYALAAAPALALCFGFAVDVLPSRVVGGRSRPCVLSSPPHSPSSRSWSGEHARDAQTAAGPSDGGFAIGVAVVVRGDPCCQVLGGLGRALITDEPSHLELVQTCLTERSTPFEPVVERPGRRRALGAAP